jgi:hypothetical protein
MGTWNSLAILAKLSFIGLDAGGPPVIASIIIGDFSL